MTVSKSSASASKKLDEVLKLTGPTDFVLLCALKPLYLRLVEPGTYLRCSHLIQRLFLLASKKDALTLRDSRLAVVARPDYSDN
jgi:hypothetical protein